MLLLAFTRSTLAFAEPIVESPRFERLSTENGLTQDFINDMLVDSDGLLWIATATGLNRYDGHDNKHFTGLENEFADDGIYSLYQDKNKHFMAYNLLSQAKVTADSLFNANNARNGQLFTIKNKYNNK